MTQVITTMPDGITESDFQDFDNIMSTLSNSGLFNSERNDIFISQHRRIDELPNESIITLTDDLSTKSTYKEQMKFIADILLNTQGYPRILKDKIIESKVSNINELLLLVLDLLVFSIYKYRISPDGDISANENINKVFRLLIEVTPGLTFLHSFFNYSKYFDNYHYLLKILSYIEDLYLITFRYKPLLLSILPPISALESQENISIGEISIAHLLIYTITQDSSDLPEEELNKYKLFMDNVLPYLFIQEPPSIPPSSTDVPIVSAVAAAAAAEPSSVPTPAPAPVSVAAVPPTRSSSGPRARPRP
jgi:hypothetical protein